MRLQITRRAHEHIRQLREYYAEKTGSSEWFDQQLDNAIQHLLQWPRSGHYQHEVIGERALFWLMSPYWLTYTVDEDRLILLAIIHTSRDLQQAMDSL